MVKVTRPKSLFGKLPYYKEQLRMIPIADLVTRGVLVTDPSYSAGMYLPFIRIVGIKRRRKIAKKNFSKAKILLKGMGV